MANTPRVRLTTSTATNGVAANDTAQTHVEFVGHPVGTIVSPQDGSILPLVALTLGQNLFYQGKLLGTTVGGTGANLGASQGILWLEGAGSDVSTISSSGSTLGQTIVSDGEGGLTFGSVPAGGLSGIVPLENGGTEADLSATGPGIVHQAAAGGALGVSANLTVYEVGAVTLLLNKTAGASAGTGFVTESSDTLATGYAGMATGNSTVAASGAILLGTGAGGVNSGYISAPTGTASTGTSGYIALSTGTATAGASGNISLNTGAAGTTSGNITLDVGVGTSSNGTISVGTTNASSLLLGGAASFNKLGGYWAFDAVTAAARLHLPAGTNAIAPLKFTTGTALATPQDGAVEYDTSHLWMTIGSTRYQLDQQTVTVADESTDTTCFPIFNTDATGTFAPKTDGYLLYNSNTGQLNAAALVINEDSEDKDTRFEGNGDANLLYLDAGNDRVGIGTASPTGKIHIIGKNTSSVTIGDITVEKDNYWSIGIYRTFSSSSANHSPYFILSRARGTSASASTILSGDSLGGFAWHAYTGSGYLETAKITALTSGTITSSSAPTSLYFFTGDINNSTSKMILYSKSGGTNLSEPGTVGTYTPSLRILGQQNNLTDDSVLRLVRDTNSSNLYGAVVDFRIKSYASGLGAPYLPKTQLTIGLKSAGAFSEDTSDVLILKDDGTGILTSGLVINESGADSDTRIEGDTATNLVVCDAGLDAFQVGTTVAGAILDCRAAEIVAGVPLETNGRQLNVATKTSGYTATTGDDLIVCNSTTAFTITLPAASGSGQRFFIKNINTGVITVDGDSGDTIDSLTTQTLNQWDCIELVDYVANAWVIV